MKSFFFILVVCCLFVNVQGYLASTLLETSLPKSRQVRPFVGRCRIFESTEEESDPFINQRQEFFENVVPRLPDSGRPPSKSEIYNDEELWKLWDLHQQLSPQTGTKKSNEDSFEATAIPSIHDLVMDAIADIDRTTTTSSSTNGNYDSQITYPWLTDEIRERSRKIKAIASDVDGTLIGSDQKVHPRTKAAIQKAVESAFSPMESLQWFFPATGKTRTGAMNSLGPDLAPLIQQCPGVFIQGLYCVYGDKVIFEKKLDTAAIEACEQLVAQTKTSIIAYDGDSLYTNDLTQTVINLHEIYGEPLSQEIPSIVGHGPGFHKILVCDEDKEKLAQVVRPQLEKLAAATNSRVTQAVPTMLELLPEGCSKALGVQKLCEVLGVNPATDLLALGDAENDVEMLQMASIGVVMGNGSPPARQAGDVILEETSDQGGAGLAMEVLGGWGTIFE